MPAPTSPEERLIARGYRVGDRLTRNLAPHFIVAGVLFAIVDIGLNLSLGNAPSLIFLGWVAFVTTVVSTWHARRPQVAYQIGGLLIGQTLYSWEQVRSLTLSDHVITIYVGEPGADNPKKIEMSLVAPPRRQA